MQKLTNASSALSVAQLLGQLKSLAEMSFPDVWVQGEVSQVSSPASGHVYFSLKDDSSLLRCVLFKNKRYTATCLPEQGKTVLMRGKVSVYTQRGDLQFITSYLEDAGEGALRREFEQLKNKLQEAGYFDPQHKQPIKPYPKHIAVVTSASGAALQDVLATLSQRYPIAAVTLVPTTVQGASAAAQICAALEQAEQETQADVILLVRGGGSAEDLHAYNDEKLADVIFNCTLPIIAGIGHETDFTIADFVADRRALTPTDAAVMATPDTQEVQKQLRTIQQALARSSQAKLNTAQQSLDYLSAKLRQPGQQLSFHKEALGGLRNRLKLAQLAQIAAASARINELAVRFEPLAPRKRINTCLTRCQSLNLHLDHAMANTLAGKRQALNLLQGKLGTLSPLSTLERGYAIVQDEDGSVISDANKVSKGVITHTRLHRGTLISEVK